MTAEQRQTAAVEAWHALSSSREYVLSDATSGTHRTDLTAAFSASSSGTDPILGFGALVLIVP